MCIIGVYCFECAAVVATTQSCSCSNYTYVVAATTNLWFLQPQMLYPDTAHTFWLYPDTAHTVLYLLVVPDICLYVLVLVLFCKSSTVLYFIGFLQNSNWSTYVLRAYTILDTVHTAENSTMQHYATFEIHKF